MWFAIGLAWLAAVVIAGPMLVACWMDGRRGWRFDEGNENEVSPGI